MEGGDHGMSSVDSRIVTMKFDNAQFQQGAATTLSTLDKLKQSMNFGTASTAATKGLGAVQSVLAKFGIKNPFKSTTDGLTEVQKGAQQLAGPGGMGTIEGGITHVSGKFVALATVAITALTNITNRAINTGTTLAKSLTVDPVKLGLEEYETNLNSIQTILANTKASGANLDDVNNALQNLNEYSDKTIYNFSEMARNIGTFTAAGVDLDTSVDSIKGIANLAALSGSNSQQAANAMYQLSQEIAAGRVSLMGWNSVVNAGMGGSTFQRALAQTAVAMGEIDESSVKLEGKMKNVVVNGQSFRDSIMAKPGEQSWLSSDVLTATLSQFTGDLSDAELAAQGFSKAQIKAINDQAKTAVDAATKVKTLTQLIDVAKETAGSGWAQTWQLVFGDFKEARKSFTAASEAIGAVQNASSDARNKMLGDWKELGGRTAIIDGIKYAWEALGKILGPIREGFREVFPPTTGEQLFAITERFRDFMQALIPGADTMDRFQRISRGVFAIFGVLWQVIKGVVGVVGNLVGALSEGSGGFLEFLASIGDMIFGFEQALKKGEGLESFFDSLSTILEIPIALLMSLGDLLGGLFDGFNSGAGESAADSLDRVGGAMSPLEALASRIIDRFGDLGEFFANFGGMIGNALRGIGSAVAEAFTSGGFEPVFDAINTGLLGGIVLLLRKFLNDGLSLNLGVGGSEGLFGGITEGLGEISGTLQAMQADLKANALLKIAGAVAILAASMVVLSLIDSAKLTKALTAMAVGFGMLIGSMAVIEKVTGFFGGVKFALISGGFIALATAILILSGAVQVLSTMSWEELAKGLGGVAALLVAVSAASVPLSANAGGMIRAGVGITALSVGIAILAGAVKIFATMSWGEMLKGLVGLAAVLTAVAFAAGLMPASLILTGPGLVAFAAGVAILAGALKIMGGMKWEEIGKGLTALAGALVLITLAVMAMPASIVLIGPGLLIVAAALTVLAGALKVMGSMSWEEIGKSMVVLFGALTLLALGLTAMIAALPGAAALVVAAAALAVLTPVLLALGAMSWESILKGLAALAGVLLVIGGAAFILQPLIPALLGLGAAVLLLGAGVALAGAGLFALAAGLSMLAAAWTASNVIILGAIGQLIGTLPAIGKALAQMFVQFAREIAKNGPKLSKAFGQIMSNMLDAVIRNTPKMGRAFMVVVNTAIGVLVRAVPQFATAGLRILIAVLEAIGKNIGRVVTTATTIVVNFLRAIGRNSGRVADAGFKMLIDFIRGLERAVDNNMGELRSAGLDLAMSIVDGMTGGLVTKGMDAVRSAVDKLSGAIPGWVKDKLGINSPAKVMIPLGEGVGEGMALGVDRSGRMVERSTDEMGRRAVDTMRRTMGDISSAMTLDPNMNPTVTPVLDLGQLTREANKMSSILATKPINTSVSYAAASDISAETQASQQAAWEAATSSSEVREIKLEQNNYSPKAIDSVTNYRQTKSLLSLAKEALDA